MHMKIVLVAFVVVFLLSAVVGTHFTYSVTADADNGITIVLQHARVPVKSEYTGDNMWKKYLKPDVHEDYDTYIPTPQDFGGFVDLVADSSTLIPYTYGDEWSIFGFRTWICISEPKDISIGIVGDDGVGLYLDGNFVCGRGNAEDPMSYGTMVLSAGWHKIEALVYTGPTEYRLEFDKKISDYVDVMDSEDIVAPVADAGFDQTVNVSETVTFDGGASTDNVNITRYFWDFGDETNATGVTTTHTYTEPGTYTVTLTVKDAADNSDTNSVTVVVLTPRKEFSWIWILLSLILIVAGISGHALWSVKIRHSEEDSE